MRYFIDTEYDWNPKTGCIVPLSIGIVAEDGRELYLVNYSPVKSLPLISALSPFVQQHVIPHMQSDNTNTFPRVAIADDIRFFIGSDTPEFWGDYAAFDYVVLSMLMGEFADWPEGWPMHINDLQQESIPSLPSNVPHNALADARAVRDSFVDATTRGRTEGA